MSLTTTNVYTPMFDLITGKYKDECPIPPYKNIEYHCLCNNKKFYTPSTFKTHIKLKSHERFLQNYINYINDINQVKEQAIQYQKLYELNIRKLNQSEKKINELNDQIGNLIHIIKQSSYDLSSIDDISIRINKQLTISDSVMSDI